MNDRDEWEALPEGVRGAIWEGALCSEPGERAAEVPRSWAIVAHRATKETMSFEEWMALGQGRGWVAEGVCQTHGMVPMSDEESERFEEGHDPCVPVLRVWTEKT